MSRTGRLLACCMALALLGCNTTSRTTVKRPATPGPVAVAGGAGLISDHGNGVISDHGSALIANNGGGLVGKSKIPTGLVANNAGSLLSDSGGSVIANNAGNIIANNAGGLVSNNAGSFKLLSVDEAPLVGFPVTIVDAAGNPVLDEKGQPYRTTTGKDGSYTFAHTPRGANLIIRLDLPRPSAPCTPSYRPPTPARPAWRTSTPRAPWSWATCWRASSPARRTPWPCCRSCRATSRPPRAPRRTRPSPPPPTSRTSAPRCWCPRWTS